MGTHDIFFELFNLKKLMAQMMLLNEFDMHVKHMQIAFD